VIVGSFINLAAIVSPFIHHEKALAEHVAATVCSFDLVADFVGKR
jgi:hypothetical protein